MLFYEDKIPLCLTGVSVVKDALFPFLVCVAYPFVSTFGARCIFFVASLTFLQ